MAFSVSQAQNNYTQDIAQMLGYQDVKNSIIQLEHKEPLALVQVATNPSHTSALSSKVRDKFKSLGLFQTGGKVHDLALKVVLESVQGCDEIISNLKKLSPGELFDFYRICKNPDKKPDEIVPSFANTGNESSFAHTGRALCKVGLTQNGKISALIQEVVLQVVQKGKKSPAYKLLDFTTSKI